MNSRILTHSVIVSAFTARATTFRRTKRPSRRTVKRLRSGVPKRAATVAVITLGLLAALLTSTVQAAEVNPNSGAFFSAWYTYAPMGASAGAAGQRWYTAQGTFAPGMRSIPVTIYETTGGMFDKPTLPGQNTAPAGTGTMAFQSCSAATFSYHFTGGTSIGFSGTIALTRVGPVPPGCTS
jgi:hypothetical protein